MPDLDARAVSGRIGDLKRYWDKRNTKFKEWFKLLWLVDQLAAKNMESSVSNEPLTFYNMAHYLLTKGDISHYVPIASEDAAELDKRAMIHRGCQYMWNMINRKRREGGGQDYIDDLSFYLLILGWYSTVFQFDKSTGLLNTQIWNPADVYPKYAANKLMECVHSYKITREEAELKADELDWNWDKLGGAEVKLDDFFMLEGDTLYNMILIDDKDVTGWVDRPEMMLMVSPVGGYPDKGTLTPTGVDWRSLAGRGIYEVNIHVLSHFNKWKTMVSQIMRDTAQPVTMEFSQSPQATTEQLRERGAHFHYAPGEQGLKRLESSAIPIEVQAFMAEDRRELQKGSFNDAVYGMVEGQPGYALSLLASSSANQILYPYMDGKHYVLSEADRFWLRNLKTSKRVFQVRGEFIEQMRPTDIPEEADVNVNSDVATPKDWLERGTIGGMLRQDIDRATLLGEVYKFSDPQGILRRQSLDRIMLHPMTQNLEMASAYEAHANYLQWRGDHKQALRFRKAAAALEAQFGAPEPGQGRPTEASEIEAARSLGTPEERPTAASNIAPPETRGFTPQELRRSIGRGQVRAV
ncbi:MAG: hypothetical protein ACWGQW_00605 [bacterium]